MLPRSIRVSPHRQRPPADRRRRGLVLVYAALIMIALIAIASLAVDVGRVQTVKIDLQKAADATARGHLALYREYGSSTAMYYGPMLATSSVNPVDSGQGTQPTVTITWGRWDEATDSFAAGSFTPPAVRVTVSRTKANNNAIPLSLISILGFKTFDASVTSVARITTGMTTSNKTISSQSDPWLAGMPSGSTASYNDTAPAQSPIAIALPANASGYITFESLSGAVATGPAVASAGPDGKNSIYSHGADSPGGPTPGAENGIADIKAPICSVIGVFLTNSAPGGSAAPAARDYTSSASRDQETYTDLQLKQPFFVGDGINSSGTIQKFRIPPGATRLFLGPMDGHEWANNTGSFTLTLKHEPEIELVR